MRRSPFMTSAYTAVSVITNSCFQLFEIHKLPLTVSKTMFDTE